MKTPHLPAWDKAFEHRIRLSAMALLLVQASVDFNTLKQELGATDGNLASHMALLEKAGYVAVRKSFLGRKPRTEYVATAAGRAAFARHLETLETFLQHTKPPAGGADAPELT